jgi:hypothetical protein
MRPQNLTADFADENGWVRRSLGSRLQAECICANKKVGRSSPRAPCLRRGLIRRWAGGSFSRSLAVEKIAVAAWLGRDRPEVLSYIRSSCIRCGRVFLPRKSAKLGWIGPLYRAAWVNCFCALLWLINRRRSDLFLSALSAVKKSEISPCWSSFDKMDPDLWGCVAIRGFRCVCRIRTRPASSVVHFNFFAREERICRGHTCRNPSIP